MSTVWSGGTGTAMSISVTGHAQQGIAHRAANKARIPQRLHHGAGLRLFQPAMFGRINSHGVWL